MLITGDRPSSGSRLDPTERMNLGSDPEIDAVSRPRDRRSGQMDIGGISAYFGDQKDSGYHTGTEQLAAPKKIASGVAPNSSTSRQVYNARPGASRNHSQYEGKTSRRDVVHGEIDHTENSTHDHFGDVYRRAERQRGNEKRM